MRICYLSNITVPSRVASSIQIVKMCEAFAKLKNEVTLITTNQSNLKLNYKKFYNVKTNFKLIKMEKFKTFPLGIKYYFFSILSIIKSFKYKPEIYITRNFFTCFLLVILKKKIIMELHHDICEESRIVQFLVKKIKFLNSEHVQKIIAITNGVKNEYIKKKLIDEKKITILASGSSIIKNFKFNHNKKTLKIGYFGSLFKSRGLNLITKLAKIDKSNNFFLYGDLTKNKNFKFKNNLHNLFVKNYVPYAEVSKELDEMDILLMPYVSSITVAGDVGDITKFTSPLKLFDYLSVGKIIICSDFQVLREILKENKNAIFIKNYTNEYSWKNEIQKLKYQPSKQFIISKNNFILSKKYSLISRAKNILKEIN